MVQRSAPQLSLFLLDRHCEATHAAEIGGGDDAVFSIFWACELNAGIAAVAAVVVLGQLLAGGVFEPKVSIDILAHHVNLIGLPLGHLDGIGFANGLGLHRVGGVLVGEFGVHLGH